MRTESVESSVADILEKVTVAKQHLKEAMDAAEALPPGESREIQEVLEPSRNHLRTAVARLQKWLDTPPAE